MTLDEFISRVHIDAENFRIYWINNNMRDPENYPLEISDDNKGVWWELFLTFNE